MVNNRLRVSVISSTVVFASGFSLDVSLRRVQPRRYLDQKSGQWKDAASFQPSDLPALLFCLSKAQEYCYETPVPGQEDAEAPGLEDETGGHF